MPTVEKLLMPKGYGATTRTLTWEDVRTRLAGAKQYWLVVNRPGGSPHVVPVDGMWVDDLLYYGGSPATMHVRAARADPHVTIHLPDPWKVVVVQGEVRLTRNSAERAQELADLANAKYPEYGDVFDPSGYVEPFAFHPRRAIAWSSFPADATRFAFPP